MNIDIHAHFIPKNCVDVAALPPAESMIFKPYSDNVCVAPMTHYQLFYILLTWHNCDLKGGKPEIGSRFLSSISAFTLASPGRWCGVATTPASMVSVTLAFIFMLPLGELTVTASPDLIPRGLASAGFISTSGSGIIR